MLYGAELERLILAAGDLEVNRNVFFRAQLPEPSELLVEEQNSGLVEILGFPARGIEDQLAIGN